MIRSAVTVSLVPEAQGGPFVYWEGLEKACIHAAATGFDAIEVFAPSPDAVDRKQLKALLGRHKLTLAAVGTGAGKLKLGLTLADPRPAIRSESIEFVARMIDFGSEFGAPAIVGSMQGSWGVEADRPAALRLLHDALGMLGSHAARRGVKLLYEPLNRYETNLLNSLADAAAFVESLEIDSVQLLADLFHMNIEEPQLAASLRAHLASIGHVHFVDSNRQAVGRGHLDMEPIALTLRDGGFDGYLSAEALPVPSSEAAAELTMEAFCKWFR